MKMRTRSKSTSYRWPGALALLLCGLVLFGSERIEAPQAAGNEGYRLLLAGETDAAVSTLRRALTEDAAFPYRWSDLGGALADSGDRTAAAWCFARSVELGPGDPQIALRAMNYQFRSGNIAAALKLGSHILRLVPNYDAMIFRTWVRMGVMAKTIETDGIGANPRAAAEWFRFLLNEAPKTDLYEYWKWLEDAGYADRELARSWSLWLLAHNEPADAAAVWARHVAVEPAVYQRADWVDNGGFEKDPSGDGFDWVMNSVPGVTYVIDPQQRHKGARSLRLNFTGLENIDFHHVTERVWLIPGHYRLSAWVRTGSLSTDQGIGVSLIAKPAADVSTIAITGTHGWTEESVEVTVSGPPRMGEIQVIRHRSLDFDNKISGSAWIDDISLLRIDPVSK
jgi:hypothetical protein